MHENMSYYEEVNSSLSFYPKSPVLFDLFIDEATATPSSNLWNNETSVFSQSLSVTNQVEKVGKPCQNKVFKLKQMSI